MRKIKEQKNKLNRSIILSIILHVLLFSFIVLGSGNKIIKLDGGEVVNAIMIVPDSLIERYKQIQILQTKAKQSDTEQNKLTQQQEAKLQNHQEKQQKHFKIVKDNHLKIEKIAKRQNKQTEDISQKAKEQQKIAEKATAQGKEEQLIKEQQEVKVQDKKKIEIAKVEDQAKTKKSLRLLEAKEKLDTKKQVTSIKNLLKLLTAQQPTQQIRVTTAASQRKNKRSKASSLDVTNYAIKIKNAIQTKFYDADIYSGKTCELRIKLAPDGKLINIAVNKSSAKNDQALCYAAIRAAKTAIMPKAPNRSIYDLFNEQGSILFFKP